MNHQIDWGDDDFPVVALSEKKKRGNPEWSVQVAVKRYLESVVPGVIVAWVRNEMPHFSGDAIARARYYQKLKVGGMRPGFPDFIVAYQGGILFVEIKPPTGRLTGDQPEIHQRLRMLGHNVAVIRSVEDMRSALAAWGVATREAA